MSDSGIDAQLKLAAHSIDDAFIDPSLAEAAIQEGLFADEHDPAHAHQHHVQHAHQHVSGSHHGHAGAYGTPGPHDMDEETAHALASTLSAAVAESAQRAQDEADAAAAAAAHSSALGGAVASGSTPQDKLHDASEGGGSLAGHKRELSETPEPIVDPVPAQAPFYRLDRDEKTPHPEHYEFTSRETFDAWLAGEDSWCHYVQRRVTTPAKRSEERARARLKKHEKAMALLPPEQAATMPAPKKRRRATTSNVSEKITYTCHHAGKYTSKHAEHLPQSKLRLNTKQSVKCGCQSKIVMNEMNDGKIKAMFFWQHQGHDPFADGKHDVGRLPKPVDDWIMAQIQAGKEPEVIRQMLILSDEEKAAAIKASTEDPDSLGPDAPPPIAYKLNIKYPDIYNRYRKFKGPIRMTKPLKTPRRKAGSGTRGTSESAAAGPGSQAPDAAAGSSGSGGAGSVAPPGADDKYQVLGEMGGMEGYTGQFGVEDIPGLEMALENADDVSGQFGGPDPGQSSTSQHNGTQGHHSHQHGQTSGQSAHPDIPDLSEFDDFDPNTLADVAQAAAAAGYGTAHQASSHAGSGGASSHQSGQQDHENGGRSQGQMHAHDVDPAQAKMTQDLRRIAEDLAWAQQ